jgi:hypothetical protein
MTVGRATELFHDCERFSEGEKLEADNPLRLQAVAWFGHDGISALMTTACAVYRRMAQCKMGQEEGDI